jgi:hypothetical protein
VKRSTAAPSVTSIKIIWTSMLAWNFPIFREAPADVLAGTGAGVRGACL